MGDKYAMPMDTDKYLWLSLVVGLLLLVASMYIGQWIIAAKSEDLHVHTKYLAIVYADAIEVIDGDTIKIKGRSYRLMGFDTPETFQAKCKEELDKGLRAKERLNQLITNANTVSIERKKRDKYKRVLAVLYIDGIDVAKIMIKEGHAVEYHGKGTRRSWCK